MYDPSNLSNSERFQYRIIKTRRKSKFSLLLMRWECGWSDYCIGWKMQMGLNIILFQSDVPFWSMLDGEFDTLKWVGFYTLTQNRMDLVVPKWNICNIQPTKKKWIKSLHSQTSAHEVNFMRAISITVIPHKNITIQHTTTIIKSIARSPLWKKLQCLLFNQANEACIYKIHIEMKSWKGKRAQAIIFD